MKLTKPGWVHHDGNPIFSIDIHPDGTRFATGGQGKDSGRVTIWNLAPVFDPNCDNNENIPKMLCQLDNHLSCVNCVRWSHSGKFLASGGDDKLIMIWKKSGQSKLNENNIIISMECWRCVGTLTGHSNDVLDMDWAIHDTWLATCSVDNTIIIWNMDKIPEIVARLTGHTGLVKGVTWDPVGQYLASQSDDKSLRIWRTKDWQQQVCITEPFKECGDMTHVLRLNWSPDGQYLVSAHASNSGGPTAQIIEIIERPIDVQKKTWSCEMDFVGHRKAVTCIKFNSNLLQKRPGSEGSKQKYCALATGSRDCALAVWCTAKKRPIVVINNIFTNSVLDISWSKDGMQLLACSWDGTIAHLLFKQEELGIIVSEQEKMTTLESLYGKSFATKHLNQTNVIPIMETPEILEFVPPTLSTPSGVKQGVTTLTTADRPCDKSMSDGETKSMNEVLQKSKQIENKTVDGKRRVKPILVPRELVDVQSAHTFSSSSEFKTKIIIEQRPEVVQPNISPAKIKALGIPVAAASVPAVSSSEVASTASHVPAVGTTPSLNESIMMKAVKRPSLLPAEVSSKRIATTQHQHEMDTAARCTHRETLLDCLHFGLTNVVRVEGTTDQVVEVENAKSADRPAKLKKETNKVLDWETVLSRSVTSLRSNTLVTVATCLDCTMHVLSTDTGRPVCLPVRLPGLSSSTTLTSNNLVCVITNRGFLYVWDCSPDSQDCPRLILRDLTLKQTLLSDCDETSYIVSCKLTQDGVPTIALSSGKCYSYSETVGWMLLVDTSSVVWKVSQQSELVRNSLSMASTTEHDLPLRGLESHVRGCVSLNNSKLSVAKQVPSQLCTAAFLQQQMNAAKALQSSLEYKILLLTLVRFYAQEGLFKPLRLILEDLLGPVHSNGSVWKDSILGLQKRELLKEALDAVAPHVLCQRLYVEFKDQLTAINNNEPMDL